MNNHRFQIQTAAALLIGLASYTTIDARQLDLAEAIDAASLSIMQTAPKGLTMSTMSTDKLRLLRTERTDGLNTIYIMSAPEASGRILFLAADDVAAPLLGYCHSFDLDNPPPALQYMLDCYSQEIARASAAGALPYTPAAAPDNRTDIAPLLTTSWNQGSPFNISCPTILGTATYTGCVATAMAQVMNYHKWPVNPTGTVSYTWTNGYSTTLSLDLSTITFDWANMLDTYSSTSSETAKQAVATLMKACGYSIDMNYGTNASGAYSSNVGPALIEHFGYAKNIQYIQRMYYKNAEWISIIYDELAASRPVQYGGFNTSAGHSFVIDGYQANGNYFHVNWGWGGMSDGYFLLHTLDPDSQGIGGSSAGYNEQQDAIIGVQKDYPGSGYVLSLSTSAPLTTNKTEYSKTESIVFGDSNDWFLSNTSMTAVSGTSGIRLTNTATSQQSEVTLNSFSDMLPDYGYSSMTLRSADIPANGEYIVDLTATLNGQPAEIRQPVAGTSRLLMTVDDTSVRIAPYESPAPKLKVTAKEMVGKAYIGHPITVSITLENTGDEFMGKLELHIMSGNIDIGALSDVVTVDIPNNESRTVIFRGDMPSTVVAGNSYTLRVYNGSQGLTLPPPPLNFIPIEAPEGTPKLTADAYEAEGVSSGDGTYANPARLTTTTLNLAVTLTNAAGVYSNEVYGYVYDLNYDYAGFLGYQIPLIGPDDTVTLNYSLDTSSLDASKTYIAMFYYYPDASGTWITNRYFYFIPSPSSATTDIEAETSTPSVTLCPDFLQVKAAGGIARVDIRSAMGINLLSTTLPHLPATLTIPTSSLQPGIYLATVTTTTGQTTTTKILIR